MSEKCIRCGNAGVDRRTLWMACFYEMSELDVPFEGKTLFHAELEHLRKVADPFSFEGQDGTKINLTAGKLKTDGELTPMKLHTLRVCKRCRGEWMDAIQRWFHAEPRGVDHDADEEQPSESCGSGIFIRDKGAIREVTREEWDNMQKHRARRVE